MASYTTTTKSVPFNPATPSGQAGIEISRSGQVVVNDYFYTDENFPGKQSPETSKFLVAATSGTLVFEYFDGKFGFIENALAGFWYPIMAKRVISSHTFSNGGNKITGAADISWYGGW